MILTRSRRIIVSVATTLFVAAAVASFATGRVLNGVCAIPMALSTALVLVADRIASRPERAAERLRALRAVRVCVYVVAPLAIVAVVVLAIDGIAS